MNEIFFFQHIGKIDSFTLVLCICNLKFLMYFLKKIIVLIN